MITKMIKSVIKIQN